MMGTHPLGDPHGIRWQKYWPWALGGSVVLGFLFRFGGLLAEWLWSIR